MHLSVLVCVWVCVHARVCVLLYLGKKQCFYLNKMDSCFRALKKESFIHSAFSQPTNLVSLCILPYNLF